VSYCFECGTELVVRTAATDGRDRETCPGCGWIHYRNPKILVSCYVTWGDKLVLLRRGAEPAYGLWAGPAGFVEIGETLEQAVAREVYEEIGATMNPNSLELFAVSSLSQINEVYIVFRGTPISPAFHAGPEVLEIGFFDEHTVPWNELAFPELVSGYIREFFSEYRTGRFSIHVRQEAANGRRQVDYLIRRHWSRPI
jgi:ADP-ribose pyrophosphatase YjhB (NUDIX family)